MTPFTTFRNRFFLRSLAHDLGRIAVLVLTAAFMIAAFAMT